MIMTVDNARINPDVIARIESLIANLPANGRVRLFMSDASQCEGRVSVRPAVETVRDHGGVEGINASVTLECGDRAIDQRLIWLDQVERIEHLDCAMGGEN